MPRELKPKRTNKPTQPTDMVDPSDKRPTSFKKRPGKNNNQWLHWTYRINISGKVDHVSKDNDTVVVKRIPIIP